MHRRALLLPCLLTSIGVVACADEDPPAVSSETIGTTSATSGSSTTTTGTGSGGSSTTATSGGTTGGTTVPELDCPTPQAPASGPFETIAPTQHAAVLQDPAEVCAPLPFAAPDGELEVYRPGDGQGAPAAGRFPVVVFHHGNTLDYRQYGYLIERMQSAGFVVLNVSTPGAPGMTGGGFGAGDAIGAMQCALRWFYFESGIFDGADCSVVMGGHSRGGLAAQNLLEVMMSDPYLEQLDPRAQVLLASSDSDNPIGVVEYVPSLAVPLLVLGSGSDADVPNQVLGSYDRMAVERDHIPPDAVPSPYRSAVWIYDVPHIGFGGVSSGSFTKTETITTAYVDRFLHWQIFGDEALRPYFVGEAVPPEILDPSWWDHLPAYDQLSDPAACSAATSESECGTAGCAWDGTDCQQLPVLMTSFTIDDRSGGAQRRLADLFEILAASGAETPGGIMDVAIGDADAITAGVGLASGHDTNAAFIQAVDGSGVSDGSAVFSVATVDGSTSAHASLRIGARSRIVQDLEAEPPVCETLLTDALAIEVALGDGINTTDRIELAPVIQQHAAFAGGFTVPCTPGLFMHTQRIPMAQICGSGFIDTENISEWSFTAPGALDVRDEFVVDTLEFTTSQDDVTAVGTCPTTTALWECVADSGLTVERAVCTAEPTGGSCPLGSVQSEFLAVPTVPTQWGGPFSGWVVHMPPGYSDDPFNPTSALQAAMEDRCRSACARQWMNDPDVSVDCDPGTAFTAVAAMSSPSRGPVRRIRPDRRDGSGFFAGQALACNLEDDCCLAFDEQACTSSALRTSPASFFVGAAEEYLFDIDSGQSELTVDANGTVDSVQLYGKVGFSQCASGNASAPCPFMLTTLEAKSIDSIKIPVTCPNGSVINRVLYHLDVDLRQPAMGIAEAGTDRVGFPAGAIVLEASFMQNQNLWNVGGPSQIDLEITASPTGFEALQIPVHGEMPACWGQDDIPAVGTFDLVLNVAAGPVESPPSITIDVPASVGCPTIVDLDATVTDPDGDDDEIAWFVDDVRMGAAVTSITFTEPHTLRAIAYDSRGAATTAVKAVTCI